MREPLVLRSDYADLELLRAWFAALGVAAKWSERDRFRIELVLTEALTNIMDYAHPVGGRREIIVQPDFGHQSVTFEVTDEGSPFNILEAESRILPKDLGEASPGGHGIRLIRKFADDIRYERVGGLNRLILGFRISGSGPLS